jgi:hypothetical protein
MPHLVYVPDKATGGTIQGNGRLAKILADFIWTHERVAIPLGAQQKVLITHDGKNLSKGVR